MANLPKHESNEKKEKHDPKNVFSIIWEGFAGTQEYRMLMLGLDAAGKTTVLYKLKLAEVVTTIPTIGFNVETVKYRNLNFTVWDVGGQHKIRRLWKHYFQGSQLLTYIVDSNDHDRIEEAGEELHFILSHEELQDVKVLILANKQDLPNVMSTTEIADKLNLRSLRHNWFIQPCSAITGDGLYEDLDWLSKVVTGQK